MTLAFTDSYYESRVTAGGYGYVVLRNGDSAKTVLGEDGDGRYTPDQATEIASVLGEAMLPQPGLGRLDMTDEQAGFMLSLLNAARASGDLRYDGGEISGQAFDQLLQGVESALVVAGPVPGPKM